MSLRDKLVDDWRDLLNHAYTVKVAILAALCQVLSHLDVIQIIEQLAPMTQPFLPEKTFSILSMVLTVAIPIARILRQKAPNA